VLSNAPTGDFKAASEWTLDFANDAAQARLMQDRLLKSGRLSVRDYTVQRQNLGDSTKQMFEVSKEYQDIAKATMEKYQKGQCQETQAWLLEQVEGLSNFTNTKAYINPTNGQVSIAKMVKKVGDDGKEVMMMDENPDNYMSVNQLRNRLNVDLPPYKYVEAIGGQVEALGDVLKTSVTKLKGAYRMLRIDEMTDPTLRTRLSDEDQQTLTAYQEWESGMIKSELANPFNQLGLLTDAIDKVPGTNDFYEPTLDAKLAESNPKYILLEDDGSGMIRPKFTESQTKAATDFLRTQTRNAVDQQTKTDLQAEPSIQYAPNYGGRGGDTKKIDKTSRSLYEISNNAIRTGDTTKLNSDEYTFIADTDENGKKYISVAKNLTPGTPVNKKTKGVKFTRVYSGDGIAPYVSGVRDKEEAKATYFKGKEVFKDAYGGYLPGNYVEGDEEKDPYAAFGSAELD